jgi:hypothetical protein
VTPLALAIACLLAVTLGYAGLCAAQPFATCRRCHGFGFATTTDCKGRPKRGKTCRHCAGHGIRIRRGRHLHNLWLRTRERGTTPDTPARTAGPGRPVTREGDHR